jgi:RNA polymerase sigma-70 factor, ECF subfamily
VTMSEHEFLAQQFERHRAHLHRVAYRMLGSATGAEDAVQESWLRVSGAGADGVDNLRGWMTTIVGRVCLDMLRTRDARREEALDIHESEPAALRLRERTAEEDVEVADSVGLALLVVLETLQPAERVAFVLHDMFDLPFDDIATIVGRSPAATRQLASRARRRVRGASVSHVDRRRKLEVVEAFLAAARSGDFDGLLAVLDPAVELRNDAHAVRMGGPAELHGSTAVAGFFTGKAAAAVPGLIDGEVGILVPVGGRLLFAVRLTFAGGRIAGIHGLAGDDAIASLDLEVLGKRP